MSDAPKFDPSKVDHKAVQELDYAFAKAAAKKKLESKQKKVDEQIDQAEATTTYTVEASDPDGDALTYAWAFTTNCGTTPGGNATTATWSHPDRSIGGNCPDEAVHPGAIAVTVSDGKGGSESYTWTRGSDVGEVRP
ncbi:MAG TPA: hypothetical protein VF998_07925 [Candidatus Limnocylindria bacterium]